MCIRDRYYFKGYYNIGNLLQDQLKLDEAIEYFSKSISLKPDYTEAYNNIGLVLYYQNKLEETET